MTLWYGKKIPLREVNVASDKVNNKPLFIQKAMKHADALEWVKAINSELLSFHKDKTLELLGRPKNKFVPSNSRVFHIKRKEDVLIDDYK